MQNKKFNKGESKSIISKLNKINKDLNTYLYSNNYFYNKNTKERINNLVNNLSKINYSEKEDLKDLLFRIDDCINSLKQNNSLDHIQYIFVSEIISVIH